MIHDVAITIAVTVSNNTISISIDIRGISSIRIGIRIGVRIGVKVSIIISINVIVGTGISIPSVGISFSKVVINTAIDTDISSSNMCERFRQRR